MSSSFAATLTLPHFRNAPLTTSPTFTMRMESPPITDTRRKQLYQFITSGPVFHSAGLQLPEPDSLEGCRTDPRRTCLDDWIAMASILEKALGRQSNDTRVYHYYLPIYFWILRELDIHKARLAAEQKSNRPFILGFSCPQGGGKTTMTTFMKTLLRTNGYNVQIASLDDFYETNKNQRQIAEAYPGNRLMQYRGMPGTHDLDLLHHTLDSLRQRVPDVSIPRYDKTAFNGRGDRAPKDQWEHVYDTTDVFLLEGWCMGFEPVEKENLVNPDLDAVNEALRDFIPIYRKIDGLFIIEISDMEWVYDWRLQAERGTRAAGRPGLTDEQVMDFVGRFMPAYKQYSSQLYNRPTPLIPHHELHIEVDSQRRPVPTNNRRRSLRD